MSRNLRLRGGLGLSVAVAAALVTTLLTVTISTATARPPARPGRVTGLALSATKPGAVYRVRASWDAATNATRYRVTMTNTAGTQLDQETVTATAFTGNAALAVNSTVKVLVVPFNGTRRGKPTTRSIMLPDLTAPVATYRVTPQNSSDGNVTLELTSISDDLSTEAGITQQIDWADGTSAVANGTVTSFPHGYGATKAVYYPVVTATDEAGNVSTHYLTAVVADTTAPTGTFSVSPAKAWANWTKVTVTQIAIQDDLSQPDKIARLVDWGDGRTQPWAAGATVTHRYKTAAAFTPTVTIADEAGNTAGPILTSAVTVTVDSVAPWVRLTLPRLRTSSVRSWTTLKGRSRDAGTGVRKVRVRAIQKRDSGWYAYLPGRKIWVRGGSTPKAAWVRSKPARVSTTTRHTWSVKLQRLTRGLLVYKVSAIDHVYNASAWKLHKTLLTRF